MFTRDVVRKAELPDYDDQRHSRCDRDVAPAQFRSCHAGPASDTRREARVILSDANDLNSRTARDSGVVRKIAPNTKAPMNIIVCIKQVPAKDAPLAVAGNWIRESPSLRDERAGQLRPSKKSSAPQGKHGGEVIALSMGPERVKQTIKESTRQRRGSRHSRLRRQFRAARFPLGSATSLAAAISSRNANLGF